jgi:hypothetical protein
MCIWPLCRQPSMPQQLSKKQLHLIYLVFDFSLHMYLSFQFNCPEIQRFRSHATEMLSYRENLHEDLDFSCQYNMSYCSVIYV